MYLLAILTRFFNLSSILHRSINIAIDTFNYNHRQLTKRLSHTGQRYLCPRTGKVHIFLTKWPQRGFCRRQVHITAHSIARPQTRSINYGRWNVKEPHFDLGSRDPCTCSICIFWIFTSSSFSLGRHVINEQRILERVQLHRDKMNAEIKLIKPDLKLCHLHVPLSSLYCPSQVCPATRRLLICCCCSCISFVSNSMQYSLFVDVLLGFFLNNTPFGGSEQHLC